ncbi:MAG: DUF971 domain-containing protein [Bacteroidota bacterium]
MPATPKRIEIDDAAQTLTITWADGLKAPLPLDALRKACPCAQCAGGHANMGFEVEPELFQLPTLQRHEVKQVEPVGHYALRIHWSDGHNSGIYAWDRLRQWSEWV